MEVPEEGLKSLKKRATADSDVNITWEGKGRRILEASGKKEYREPEATD